MTEFEDLEKKLTGVTAAPLRPEYASRVRALIRSADERRPRSRRWIALAAAAAILVAVGVAVRWTVPEAEAGPRAASVRGLVTRDGRPLADGDALCRGETVATSDGAAAELLFEGDGRMELAASTEVRVGEPRARGPVAALERGTISCTVPPGSGPFVVSTPRGALAVAGTRFRVSYEPAGVSRAVSPVTAVGAVPAGPSPTLLLAVFSGCVEFREAARCTLVPAGQGLLAAEGVPPRVTPLTAAGEPEYRPLPGSTSVRSMQRAVSGIDLAPDGRRLAIGVMDAGGGGIGESGAGFVGVHVYDLEKGRFTATVRLDGIPSGVAWDSDGNLWATESLNNEIRRVDVRAGRVAESFPVEAVPNHQISNNTSRLYRSPDGEHLLLTGYDRRLALFSVPGWKLARTLHWGGGAPPTEGAWNRGGSAWVAATSDAEVLVWDTATGESERVGTGRSPAFDAAGRVWAATPDSLAWGPVNPRPDEKRRCWLSGGTKIRQSAFSPAGDTVALGLDDGSVVLLEPASARELARFPHETEGRAWRAVSRLLWAPDSSWLAVGRWDGSSEILRTTAAPKPGGLRFSDDGGKSWSGAGLAGQPVREIVPDPKKPGSALVLAGSRSTTLWRTTDRGRTWNSLSPGFAPLCAAAAPDGAIWAGGAEGALARSGDGGRTWTRLRLDDVARTTMFAGRSSLKNVRAIAFLGKRVFVAGGQGDGFVAVTSDDGETFEKVGGEGGWAYVWALWGRGERLLVGGDFGLRVSADAGATFADSDLVGECLGTGGRFSSTHDGKHVVFSLRGTVVKSSDGGATFAAVPQPEKTFLDSLARAGGRWLAVGLTGKRVEEGPMRMFQPDGGARLYESADGKEWTPVEAAPGTPTVIRGTCDGKGLWLGTK